MRTIESILLKQNVMRQGHPIGPTYERKKSMSRALAGLFSTRPPLVLVGIELKALSRPSRSFRLDDLLLFEEVAGN